MAAGSEATGSEATGSEAFSAASEEQSRLWGHLNCLLGPQAAFETLSAASELLPLWGS